MAPPTLPDEEEEEAVEREEGERGEVSDTESVVSAPAERAGALSYRLYDKYVIRTSLQADLRFSIVLQRPDGPPYDQPVWLLNVLTPLPVTELRKLKQKLTVDARTILSEPNAGGSSVNSEALSMEIMAACFRAELLLTETEVEYDSPDASIVDYVARIGEHRVGVSVTRAMKYNGGPDSYSERDAALLLVKKLVGLKLASEDVSAQHGWTLQMLHIWAETDHIAQVLHRVLHTLPAALWETSLVVCTVCRNMHHIIFQNADDFALPPDTPASDPIPPAVPIASRIPPLLSPLPPPLISHHTAPRALPGPPPLPSPGAGDRDPPEPPPHPRHHSTVVDPIARSTSVLRSGGRRLGAPDPSPIQAAQPPPPQPPPPFGLGVGMLPTIRQVSNETSLSGTSHGSGSRGAGTSLLRRGIEVSPPLLTRMVSRESSGAKEGEAEEERKEEGGEENRSANGVSGDALERAPSMPQELHHSRKRSASVDLGAAIAPPLAQAGELTRAASEQRGGGREKRARGESCPPPRAKKAKKGRCNWGGKKWYVLALARGWLRPGLLDLYSDRPALREEETRT